MTHKTVTYDDVRAISLSVGDMLSLQNALYDAIRYNERGNYPNTAKTIEVILRKIQVQVDPWINEADAFVLSQITQEEVA